MHIQYNSNKKKQVKNIMKNISNHMCSKSNGEEPFQQSSNMILIPKSSEAINLIAQIHDFIVFKSKI